jgi:hypothetical protein
MRKKMLYILAVLAYMAMIAANWAANGIPLNGYTTGAISEMYPNAFVPAGITFSIWGLIYLLLLIMLFYLRPFAFDPTTSLGIDLRKLLQLFLLTCALNIAWIVTWHYLMPLLSLLIMFIFLASLALITAVIGTGIPQGNSRMKYFVHFPFSLYFGWISVAILANVTAVLVDMNWTGFGIADETWAMILMLIATGFALIMMQWRKDVVYSMVVVWALFGIAYKQSQITGTWWEGLPLVALAGVLVILLSAALQINRIRDVYFS